MSTDAERTMTNQKALEGVVNFINEHPDVVLFAVIVLDENDHPALVMPNTDKLAMEFPTLAAKGAQILDGCILELAASLMRNAPSGRAILPNDILALAKAIVASEG